jgi:hypothetical protein
LGNQLHPLGALRSAHAADVVFSGAQRVTSATLTIRLDDGAPVETRLPSRDLTAAAIIARYHLADRLQITCTAVNVRDFSGSFFRAQETSISAAGFGGRVGTNHHLYDELAKRWTAQQNNPAWQLLDTIESEITFKGSEPVRQNIRINGKPCKKPGDPVNWSADFGVELEQVFGLECPNTFDFEGRQEVRGQQLLVYRFSSPPDGCFGWNGLERQGVQPGPEGPYPDR